MTTCLLMMASHRERMEKDMAKKFDNYEAFKAEGFEESVDQWGRIHLTRTFTKMIEVAWYGKQESIFTIDIWFNPAKTICTASYTMNVREPFKVKTHLNDKRAYNAIHLTAEYNGFAF